MGKMMFYRIIVCMSCKYKGMSCKLGFDFIKKLCSVIEMVGDVIFEDFEIFGVVCMVGCDWFCIVVYYGFYKVIYLFGDIDLDIDIQDLVEFVQ